MVTLLLEKGADVDAQTRKEFSVGSPGHQTPLHLAILGKHWEIVKFLLANGANFTILDIDNKKPSQVCFFYFLFI